MKKIYTNEEAKAIKERKRKIEEFQSNKPACARRGVEEYYHLKELERLENEWLDYE